MKNGEDVLQVYCRDPNLRKFLYGPCLVVFYLCLDGSTAEA